MPHTRYVPYLLAASLACACAPAGPSRSATLFQLQLQLGELRRGEIDTAQPTAELAPLVGARSNQVIAALGRPRVCQLPVEPPCEREGELVWSLHDAGEAGPDLVLDVEEDRVVRARWRNAPRPLR